METLKNNLADLIDVKTLVTIGVLFVYIVLALRGDILPDNVNSTFSMVIAFYFGTQFEKKKRDRSTLTPSA